MVKDLSVTRITPVEQSGKVGDTIEFIVTVERYPNNYIYEGTLVIQVDDKTVGKKENIKVGGDPAEYRIPVKFQETTGERVVCGTVIDISQIDDPIV